MKTPKHFENIFESLKTLRLAAAVFFGALLSAGAFYYALTGLVHGEVFCLLCKRGSAPASFAKTPVLWLVSELMLLGLGAVCLAGTVYGLRDLRRAFSGQPEGEADAARSRQAAPYRPTRPTAQRQPASAPATTNAPTKAAASPRQSAAWLEPSRRPPPRAPSPWAGLLVHGLAALCMLATLVLGGLALTTRHSSSDLGFGVLLLWLMPLGSFFWGSAFLAMSPRPGVSRVGQWLLLLMVGAAVVLGLAEKLFGSGSSHQPL